MFQKHNPDTERLTVKILQIILCITYLKPSAPFCSSTPRHVRHSCNPRSGSEFRRYASIKVDNSDLLSCGIYSILCSSVYKTVRAAFQFRLPTPHSVLFRASERAHFVARNSDFRNFAFATNRRKVDV
jgi:hypothetical protein